MERKVDFFRDEVRNGFYIPAVIKQAWAETLSVLDEIDRICEKHHIRYFADWGTFLGAVRHGGFVPWDDDLDVCMLRDDYEKFRRVADSELPEGYVIHDYERKEDHWLFLARVVNSGKMCFTKEYLDKHNNFPWLAGVDIFLKDYLYKDEGKELRRDKDVMEIISVADAVMDGSVGRQYLSARINEIKRRYRISLPGKYRERDVAVALYGLAEKQMAVVRSEETDKVGQIFPWVLKNGMKAAEDKERYEKFIRLPFEDTTIPVPAAYNEVLASRYGDYCHIRKVWTGHDYPFFEGQKEEMEKLSGTEFMGFGFNRDMLKKSETDRSSSIKVISKECIAELSALLKDAEVMLQSRDIEAYAQNIADSQQLAADLGTLIEETKGESRDCTVKVIEALQEYCDALFNEYQEVADGKAKDAMTLSSSALEKVRETVQEHILERREVLFLPVGAGEWKGMKTLYRESLKETATDVFVVPLPLMKKDIIGKVTMTDEEIAEAVGIEYYPEGVSYTDWMLYDIRVHCPDVIYIQNPYDERNPCLTVPPVFYASNLRRYTDKLIYIPISKTGEFGVDDVNDRYNMKHYVTAPGIVFADETWVQSGNIREQYVDVLTGFAGEDTKKLWQDRIRAVEGLYEDSAKDESMPVDCRKKLLYCIGANELAEHGSIFADSLRDKLKTLSEHGTDIHVSVALYPADRSQWRFVDGALSDVVFNYVDTALDDSGFNMIKILPYEADAYASEYDAYYGSPSPFVPAFVMQNKPVMLANYEV